MNITELSPTKKYKLFEKMLGRGGIFAKTLAQAWFVADPSNKRIIEESFSHILVEYAL